MIETEADEKERRKRLAIKKNLTAFSKELFGRIRISG
jgi:hypothetical protein